MIPPIQFLQDVIGPTLTHLAAMEPRLDTPAARALLLGTAIQESHLSAYKQLGGGPAMSFFQIEPATFEDIFDRYLSRPDKSALRGAVRALLIPAFEPGEQLDTNQHLACAIARIRYWMVPERMPRPDDIDGLAVYWKLHYNTTGGGGSASEWALNFRKYAS
ncbi:hypothetical protein LCGC14_0231840 [marine sediment metagenome]|uniref:Uncharacterized protein n=1 Tax=marine sediment metagenome TaxID=412755 RepID=A0A0F9WUN6_9ZZZZ